MIYIAGIVITSFLSLILVTKKRKSLADKILFTWLCVILVHLVLFSIISSQAYLTTPHLLGLEIPFPLLHGPFLFLYTVALTSGRVHGGTLLFHFLPFALVLMVTAPFYLLSTEEKIIVYQNGGKGFETLTLLIFVAIVLSGISYAIISLRTLSNYKQQLKDNFSSIEQLNLQWLFRLVIGLSFIWLLVFFAEDEIIFSAVVLFVVFIGYYGIKQVGVFTNFHTLELSTAIASSEPMASSFAAPENSHPEEPTAVDPQLKAIHCDLQELMRQQKLFLTPELTLTMVAQALEVHPNTLSHVINSMEQKNFFDYVNTLRIEAFKERIANPDHQKYTLLSIAYECGFNSKTSFNRNFKNLTGQSPSDYLKGLNSMQD